MEKKLTNSGRFMESTSKHSIYTFPGNSLRVRVRMVGDVAVSPAV